MRRGENQCRILEQHLKLKDQQTKTTLFVYRLLYQNLMGTPNQQSTIHTDTKEKKSSKTCTKDRYRITKDEKRKGRKKLFKKSQIIKKMAIGR